MMMVEVSKMLKCRMRLRLRLRMSTSSLSKSWPTSDELDKLRNDVAIFLAKRYLLQMRRERVRGARKREM